MLFTAREPTNGQECGQIQHAPKNTLPYVCNVANGGARALANQQRMLRLARSYLQTTKSAVSRQSVTLATFEYEDLPSPRGSLLVGGMGNHWQSLTP